MVLWAQSPSGFSVYVTPAVVITLHSVRGEALPLYNGTRNSVEGLRPAWSAQSVTVQLAPCPRLRLPALLAAASTASSVLADNLTFPARGHARCGSSPKTRDHGRPPRPRRTGVSVGTTTSSTMRAAGGRRARSAAYTLNQGRLTSRTTPVQTRRAVTTNTTVNKSSRHKRSYLRQTRTRGCPGARRAGRTNSPVLSDPPA